MLNAEQSTEFITFLKEYSDFYKTMLELIEKKIKLVTTNDLTQFQALANHEHALYMKSRVMEKNRIELMEKFENKDTTLANFITLLDGSVQQEATIVKETLSEVMLGIKEKNKLCSDLAEARLRSIGKNINNIQHDSNNKVIPNFIDTKTKKEIRPTSSVISTKI